MFLHKRGIGLIRLMKPKREEEVDILISEAARERGGRVFPGQWPGASPKLGSRRALASPAHTGDRRRGLSPALQMRVLGPGDPGLTLKAPQWLAEGQHARWVEHTRRLDGRTSAVREAGQASWKLSRPTAGSPSPREGAPGPPLQPRAYARCPSPCLREG